jgi:hypothetical protein
MPATRRRSCKRNNKQYGGGLGGVVNSTPASFGHLVNNPLSWSAGSSCLAQPRPGFLTGLTPHGLPGMAQSGGRRKRKNSRKNRRQHGGAYGFVGGSGIVGGYPGSASYAPMTHVGCTGSSGSVIPDSGAADSLNRTGGSLWDGPKTSGLQRGGAYELGETLKTAGYSSLQPGANGVIQTGAGTLLSVNVPMAGRMAGGACGMQKGGRRNSRRGSRKNRKNRKNSRKNRR